MNFLWLSTVIICLAIGYAFGYHARDAIDQYQKLRAKLANKPKERTPHSTIIEPPLTMEQKIQREHEEMLERLNPS